MYHALLCRTPFEDYFYHMYLPPVTQSSGALLKLAGDQCVLTSLA